MEKKQSTENLERDIYREIIKGTPSCELQKMIREDHWNHGIPFTNITSCRNIITRVRKRISEDWAQEQKELRNTLLTRMLDIYKECRERGDLKTAHDVLKSLSKLGGLDQPERIDLNIGGDVTISFE